MIAPSFMVESVNEQGLVLGRNGCLDIPVGFVFTSITKVRVEGPTSNLRGIPMGIVCSVSLRVEEIHWYQRAIEVIPGGHSAGLRLSGNGLTELQTSLTRRSNGEYLSLEGPGSIAQPALPADVPGH